MCKFNIKLFATELTGQITNKTAKPNLSASSMATERLALSLSAIWWSNTIIMPNPQTVVLHHVHFQNDCNTVSEASQILPQPLSRRPSIMHWERRCNCGTLTTANLWAPFDGFNLIPVAVAAPSSAVRIMPNCCALTLAIGFGISNHNPNHICGGSQDTRRPFTL